MEVIEYKRYEREVVLESLTLLMEGRSGLRVFLMRLGQEKKADSQRQDQQWIS